MPTPFARRAISRIRRLNRSKAFGAMTRLTSGPAVKLNPERSYGFRTFRILELALYHSLGKLPEPELTHEFF